jgi:hypothetical protein
VAVVCGDVDQWISSCAGAAPTPPIPTPPRRPAWAYVIIETRGDKPRLARTESPIWSALIVNHGCLRLSSGSVQECYAFLSYVALMRCNRITSCRRHTVAHAHSGCSHHESVERSGSLCPRRFARARPSGMSESPHPIQVLTRV